MGYVAKGSQKWKTDWNPTLSGFSVVPTGQTARYANDGKSYNIFLSWTGNGTSNATIHTFTLPAVSAVSGVIQVTRIIDNGAAAVSGYIFLTAGSNIAQVLPSIAGSNWTPSGGARYSAAFKYQAQ